MALGLLAASGAVWFVRSRPPLPGKVIVTVQPAVPAELLVDGRSSGPLPPFVRHLPAGRHRLEVRAEGYKPFLAAVETYDNGKPIRETNLADLPLAVDHFRYFAGCVRAQEGSLGDREGLGSAAGRNGSDGAGVNGSGWAMG